MSLLSFKMVSCQIWTNRLCFRLSQLFYLFFTFFSLEALLVSFEYKGLATEQIPFWSWNKAKSLFGFAMDNKTRKSFSRPADEISLNAINLVRFEEHCRYTSKSKAVITHRNWTTAFLSSQGRHAVAHPSVDLRNVIRLGWRSNGRHVLANRRHRESSLASVQFESTGNGTNTEQAFEKIISTAEGNEIRTSRYLTSQTVASKDTTM